MVRQLHYGQVVGWWPLGLWYTKCWWDIPVLLPMMMMSNCTLLLGLMLRMPLGRWHIFTSLQWAGSTTPSMTSDDYATNTTNTDKTITPRHDMDTDETYNNELEITIELPLNNWQREWAQRFNNITDNTDLEDTMTQFLGEVTSIQPRTTPPRTQKLKQQPLQRPRQPQQRRRKQHQQDHYDAATASHIQRKYRQSRARAVKEVTEAESQFCTSRNMNYSNTFPAYFSRKNMSTQRCQRRYPHAERLTGRTATHSQQNLHRTRYGGDSAVAEIPLRAQTESAIRIGKRSTEAAMSSTPYSTRCNDSATYHNAGGNQQQYYYTKRVTNPTSQIGAQSP